MPHIDRETQSFSYISTTYLTLCLLCLLGLLPVQASQLETIREAALSHVQANLPPLEEGQWDVSAAALDSRLRFAPCVTPLETQSPTLSAGHRVIQVRCAQSEGSTNSNTNSNAGWSLYVPVKIRQLLPQIVARQNLGPGTVLDQGVLMREEREVRSGRARHFSDYSSLLGARVKRTVSAGTPITPNHICLVCRKDSVTIIARAGSLQVKSYGEALSDGTIGETISVRNDSSRRVVRARVTALGVVEVSL